MKRWSVFDAVRGDLLGYVYHYQQATAEVLARETYPGYALRVVGGPSLHANGAFRSLIDDDR